MLGLEPPPAPTPPRVKRDRRGLNGPTEPSTGGGWARVCGRMRLDCDCRVTPVNAAPISATVLSVRRHVTAANVASSATLPLTNEICPFLLHPPYTRCTIFFFHYARFLFFCFFSLLPSLSVRITRQGGEKRCLRTFRRVIERRSEGFCSFCFFFFDFEIFLSYLYGDAAVHSGHYQPGFERVLVISTNFRSTNLRLTD